MKLWQEFYDYARTYLPGIGEPQLDLHLRQAAREFFKQTEVMTAEDVPVVLEANKFLYTFNPEDLLETTRVLSLRLVGEGEITPITRDKLIDERYNWATASGTPMHYFQVSPRQVRIFPIPDKTYNAVLTAVVQPSKESVGVHDEFFDEYVESISFGAVSRATRMPQKPWTNFDLSNSMGALFQTAIRNSKIERNKDFTNVDLRVQYNKIV